MMKTAIILILLLIAFNSNAQTVAAGYIRIYEVEKTYYEFDAGWLESDMDEDFFLDRVQDFIDRRMFKLETSIEQPFQPMPYIDHIPDKPVAYLEIFKMAPKHYEFDMGYLRGVMNERIALEEFQDYVNKTRLKIELGNERM